MKISSLNPNLIASVSPRTGILQALHEIPFHHDDPTIYAYGSVMADTSRFSAHQCGSRNGGAGLSREQAIGAAIGESLERYCCNFYNRSSLPLGSFKDFSSDAVAPSEWILFSETQYSSEEFPWQEFAESTRIAWAEGKSLISHQPKLVPAAMTYLPYHSVRGETIICPSISTGLSCRETEVEAILSAIYECIERDAFTIYWLNALHAPRIVPEEIPDKVLRNTFIERFARPGIQYYIWDITLDIPVASYFCVAIGTSSIGQLLCVGTASHFDPSQAFLKALIEASQGRPFLRYLHASDPTWSCKDDFSNINYFDDHARVYTKRPELLTHLDFCTKVGNVSGVMRCNESTGDPEEDLNKVLSLLEARGFDVIVVDLTTPDVRELGFRVVRVFIPGLQPLHGDHCYPFLGGKRWSDVPFRLGLRDEPLTEEARFKLPHPFP
jgi:ribosomal protein S12 methylthiotransferase accessory factor